MKGKTKKTFSGSKHQWKVWNKARPKIKIGKDAVRVPKAKTKKY